MNFQGQDIENVWHKLMSDDTDKSFIIIYNYYIDKLYSYGRYLGFDSEMCKDAIQDVFIKLYTIRHSKRKISNPTSFLFQSLKNRLIDITRKNKNEYNIEILNKSHTIDITVLDDIIDRERASIIKEKVISMLSTLTETQREAVFLRYISEMDYSEISERLNIKPESARKLMHRAIKTLREQNIGETPEATLLSIFIILSI